MATDVGIKVKVDGEKTFRTAIQAINQQCKELSAEMKASMAGMNSMANSEEKVAQQTKLLSDYIDKNKEKVQVLSQQYDNAKARLDELGKELNEAKQAGGDNTAEVQKAENAYNKQAAEVAKLGTQLANTNAEIKASEAKLKELGNASDSTAKKLKSASDNLKKIGTSLQDAGSTLTKIGSTLSKTVTAPIVAAGTAAVKLASDYDENLNKVDTAFKDSADVVKKWAKTATQQFGMSESAALEATSLFGDMGTAMGLTTKEAATMATGLAGLAGDLASFKNIGVDQAMNALKGIFTGETESLKSLGVVMTQTNLKQFAADMGLVYDSMSESEKVTLRYQYVLEKTANAQGDYARTSDGTANSIRTLKSSVENLGASFGQQLVPVITPLIQKLTSAVNAFGNLSDSQKEMVVKLAAVAAAVGPATTALGKLTTGLGTLLVKSGEVVGALSSGTGLGSALVGTLGVGGTIGLAVAGMAAFTVGSIALGNAIDGAVDPVKRLDKALQGISDARESISKSNEIIDLANQYEILRARTQDATLSEEEHAEAQEELQSILAQLESVTDGAITATQSLTDATDDQVAALKELNEEERQRSQADVYAALVQSADAYGEALLDQKRLTKEVADETEALQKLGENNMDGAANALESLQKIVDDTRQKLEEGIISADTVEGAEDLQRILDDLARQIKEITGEDVSFDSFAEAEDYFDNLSYSVDDATESYQENAKALEGLKSDLSSAQNIVKQYEQAWIEWVKNGGDANTAAEMLGISVEGLQRKMQAYDQETTQAMIASGELAPAMEEVEEAATDEADALDEAAEAAAENRKAIMDVAYAAVDARTSGENLRDSYNELSSELDKLRDSGDETAIMLAEQELHLLDLAATNEELAEGFSKMGIKAEGSLTALSQYLIEAGVSSDEYLSGVQSMRDGVVNSFKTIRDENALTASEMTQVLRDNLEVQRNWGQNLADLWRSTSDNTVRAYINYLYQQGPQYAAAVDEFAHGGYDELVEQAYLWSEAGQLSSEQYAAGIWMNEYLAEQAGYDISDAADNGLASADTKGTGKDEAKDFTKGFGSVDTTTVGNTAADNTVTGIKQQQQAMKQASQALAKGAVDMIKNAAPQFRAAGTTIGQNLVSGYQAQLASSRSAASTMANNMVSAIRGMAATFRSAGATLAQQMISGMTSALSSFRSAGLSAGQYFTAGLQAQAGGARSAAYALASGSANSAASLVSSFRNAGYSSGSSFASGVSSAAGSAKSAGSYVAKSALNSAYISGWYNVGYNAASGIASGLYGGSYLISNAAYTAAKRALATAKSALGIRSPSRVFRDEVGMMIGAGMAEGIKNSAGLVTGALDAVNSNLVSGVGGGAVRNSTYNLTPTIYVYGSEGQDVDELAMVVEQKINENLIRRL